MQRHPNTLVTIIYYLEISASVHYETLRVNASLLPLWLGISEAWPREFPECWSVSLTPSKIGLYMQFQYICQFCRWKLLSWHVSRMEKVTSTYALAIYLRTGWLVALWCNGPLSSWMALARVLQNCSFSDREEMHWYLWMFCTVIILPLMLRIAVSALYVWANMIAMFCMYFSIPWLTMLDVGYWTQPCDAGLVYWSLIYQYFVCRCSGTCGCQNICRQNFDFLKLLQ